MDELLMFLLVQTVSSCFLTCSSAAPTSNESQNDARSVAAVASSLCVLVMVVSLALLSVLCCHYGKRSEDCDRGEDDEKQFSPGGIDDVKANSPKKGPIIITRDDFKGNNEMQGALESPSLDYKLTDSLDDPVIQRPLSSKQRSPRASFRLPILPSGQCQTAATRTNFNMIPVPKLLAKARGPPAPPAPQLPPESETSMTSLSTVKIPLKLSPVMHRNPVLKDRKGLSVDAVESSPSTEKETGKADSSGRQCLVHTKSLDDLLCGEGSVVVELTANKKAKYSRMVITASACSLDPDQQSLPPENQDLAEAQRAPPTGAEDEQPLSDSSSIASYRLTPDMLSSDSASEHEGSGDCDKGKSPVKDSQEERVDDKVDETIPHSQDLEETRANLSDQEKAKMMPIPTAPPSPPKGKPNALTLKCEAPTATQLPLSPPVSPMSNASSKESTLDRGKRLTVVERRPSPHAGSSMASNPTDVESYAAIKKPKQKKKRKGSHSDQPLLSPPHTPPPLPPSLEELSREGKVSSNKGDNAGTPRHQLQDEADDDLGVTCLRCKKSLASGESTTSDSPITTTVMEPIYHVLENPLMCDSCLILETSGYRRERLPCPSPPPAVPLRDYHMPKSTRDPLYERVLGEREQTKRPPISLKLKSTSSDYESIPSFGKDSKDLLDVKTRVMLGGFKGDSSDYESIASLDCGAGEHGKMVLRRAELTLSQLKCDSNNSSHDYETIDNFTATQSIDDLESPDSPPFVPENSKRNKFLKIDSQGYASVLYPHEEDDSWEFDCLNQDKPKSSNSSNSNVTVHNVEEVWKHQLEKGYAPLTMNKIEAPPLFSRTRSAPNAPLPTPNPQDYEVPLHLLMPIPPPPIARRRVCLIKQPALCMEQNTPSPSEREKILCDVREEDNDEEDSSGHTSLPSEQLAPEDDTSSKMRSRVMTAPTLTFQTFISTTNSKKRMSN